MVSLQSLQLRNKRKRGAVESVHRQAPRPYCLLPSPDPSWDINCSPAWFTLVLSFPLKTKLAASNKVQSPLPVTSHYRSLHNLLESLESEFCSPGPQTPPMHPRPGRLHCACLLDLPLLSPGTLHSKPALWHHELNRAPLDPSWACLTWQPL